MSPQDLSNTLKTARSAAGRFKSPSMSIAAKSCPLRSTVRASLAILALLATAGANSEVYLTEGTNISVDVSRDGRAAFDLLGGIWILPVDGGDASALQAGLRPAQRPRWSPTADTLVYQASGVAGDELWLHDVVADRGERLGNRRHFDQHPDWHPGGRRIIFSSDRGGDGFDLWEIDLLTRLAWRLSDLPGDETDPAWSDDGRDLIYVHENAGQWSLMLRSHGQPDRVLLTSEARLSAPSWRPDGSLVTYMREAADGWSVRMLILSNPVLDRPLIDDEDFFVAPIAWLDRQQFLYTTNGQIRRRRFDSWTSSNVPFRAAVGKPEAYGDTETAARELPAIEEPPGMMVIRAGRLFDGVGDTYRNSADIVIEGGHIAAVEDRQDRAGVIVIDLGDITVIPGFIDAYGKLPDDVDESLGPLLLGLGVTTLVTEHEQVEALDAVWSGKDVPGPRVLAAKSMQDAGTNPGLPWLVTISGDMSAGIEQRNAVRDWQSQGVAVLADSWQVGLGAGAALLLGTQTMPASPAGISYQDVQLARGSNVITLVSGIADVATPGIDELLRTRLAAAISAPMRLTRRFGRSPDLTAAATTIVLGSRPNGLPPGIALHAEFRGLIKAGLNAEQALKAAGVNAADALGMGRRLGRIATGAAADLLLIDGDPLANIGDAINIIAVVRNGRFFSVSGLVDRAAQARQAQTVE